MPTHPYETPGTLKRSAVTIMELRKLPHTEEELMKTIVTHLHNAYILGGISAIESLGEAVPPMALDLPEDARKMLTVILTVMDNFTDAMRKKFR
jgi:hypothetical protein